MNKLKKAAVWMLTAVLSASTVKAVPVKAAEPKSQSVKLSVPNNKVPTYQYQKAQDFVIDVTNTGSEEITNLTVKPNLQDSNAKWPFKTDYQSYSETMKSLKAGATAQIKFNFTQRDDAGAARYTLQFDYTADDSVSGSSFFYINTSAKPEEQSDTTDNQQSGIQNSGKQSLASQRNSSDDGIMLLSQSADAGGYSNSEAAYSGSQDAGGGSGSGSVPRVIVTGFSTDPAEVKAGTDFTLTIHLKNTSKTSKVSNMLFDLSAPEEGADEQSTAPAFLPSSGSSSIYLDGMKANGTADISIKLNAKADLLQKPYSVELSMKYEDKDYNGVEATSSLSIPIKRDARFEFSDFEINPESIAVGEEASVMCNLYNLGRIKLYNVKAVFEGACIVKEEVFVGNVESGATASIDAMLEGSKASEEPADVKMTVSYENEEGEVTTVEKDLKLEVTEEPADDMAAVGEMEEAKDSGLPILPVVLILAVIAIAVAVIAFKKKKKKQMQKEEEELLYELDGSSEDEQQ